VTVQSNLSPEPPRSIDVDAALGVRIPTRDGTTLHAAVWRPIAANRPVAVVMEMTPYGIDHLNEDGVFWADSGFAYVAIDCRGRGSSDGEFVPFLTDAADGYDAVEWLAAQSWCDGQVALHGGSYTGINQYLILAAAPPSLRAITPDSTTGFGTDLPKGGVPCTYELGWRRLISNRATQFDFFGDQANWHRRLYDATVTGTSLVEAARSAGAPVNESSLKAIDHPEPGPRWEKYRASPADLARSAVPVLSITGMYDDSSGGTIDNWRRFVDHAPANVVNQSHLVVGPWDHMGTHFGEGKVGEIVFGPEATVKLAELRRDWLRHVLHDAPAPEFLRDRVSYYLTGTEEWRWSPSLDATNVGTTVKHLRSVPGVMDAAHAGFVDDQPGEGPDAEFICDPTDFRTHRVELQPRTAGTGPESRFHGAPMNNFFSTIGGNDPTNPRFVLDLDGQGVVYTSATLAEDLTIVGEPQLHMRVTCDQPDADIAVLVHEITPAGDSIFLTSDLLRLSCRALDGSHQWLLPGMATDIHLRTFKWCQRTVQAGSRVRIAIRHAFAIQLTAYPHGRPEDAPVAHLRIHHDADAAPRFVLPLG
jgi:uncharacterized protein